MTPDERFEANMPLAVFVLRKYCGRYDEDDLQEAYMALWQAAETYREEKGAFSTYAAAMIRNHMERRGRHDNAIKRRGEREKLGLIVEDRSGDPVELDIPDPEDMESEIMVREFWRRARNELTEKEYRIVWERALGMTMAEIGAGLGKSKQSVNQYLQRRPLALAREVFGE